LRSGVSVSWSVRLSVAAGIVGAGFLATFFSDFAEGDPWLLQLMPMLLNRPRKERFESDCLRGTALVDRRVWMLPLLFVNS